MENKQPKMGTLTVRIRDDLKENLDEAAYRVGFSRMKEGELKGDISALLNMLARALPGKSADEIMTFLVPVKREEKQS